MSSTSSNCPFVGEASGDLHAVIVGTGLAGVQAALRLRELNFPGAVTLIGEEHGAPYQRPPLSKSFLDGKADASTLATHAVDEIASRGICLRLGLVVEHIDRNNKQLVLSSGEPMAYTHVVLATGARNRSLKVPGVDLEGVRALRTLADGEALRRHIATAKRIVVVGAGFLGMEVAAEAARRGTPVTVVEAAERAMHRAVSEPVSKAFERHHAQRGVHILFGEHVRGFTGTDGRVTAVLTDKAGSIPADLVLVAIGVTPNTQLAEAAGLATSDGILVDEALRTNDPDIFCVGDGARFRLGDGTNATARIESVQNAMDQGRFVAERLTGGEGRYQAVPWFWSDQAALRLQIAGSAQTTDAVVVGPVSDQGAFSAYRFRHERLVAVESVNEPRVHFAARKRLAEMSLPSIDALRGAGFDLRRA